MRTQQNVTHLDAVATLLDELDDVETVFRLHHLGHLGRVLQVERHIGKSGVELPTAIERHLTAILGRSTVFRIHTGQRGETGLALVDTVGEVAQTPLHVFHFLDRNAGFLCNNLHLDLSRDVRNAVRRKVLEIAAHLGRRNLNVAYQLLLHALHRQTLTGILAQGFTNLRGTLIPIFLHLLHGSDAADILANHVVYLADHFALGHFDTVELRLMQEQLLDSDFLGYHAIRITVELASVVHGVQTHFFHFRFQDGLITHDPYHFIDDIVLSPRREAGQQHSGQSHYKLNVHTLFHSAILIHTIF